MALLSDSDIEKYLLESSSEEEVGDEVSEVSDHENVSEHSTDTETDLEHSDGSDVSDASYDTYFLGRDKSTKWRKLPPKKNVRTRSVNIVSCLPVAKSAAASVDSPLSAFLLLIDNVIINLITFATNVYIEKISSNYKRRQDAKPTDFDEIKALMGLLLLAGIKKSGRQNVRELWDQNGLGTDIFPAVMSVQRFSFLLRCLRFDDIRDRQQRREIDKLAAVREMFDVFVSNCQKTFSIGEYMTIDEQLVPFRGRCPFRQYMPKKPARYGIKIFALADARTFYTYSMEIYPGIQPDGPFRMSNSPSDVVTRLCKPIFGTGRNITVDNWFTSIPLSQSLLGKKLTLVGTLKKNKKEIPPEFLSTKGRQEFGSLFGFKENGTIVSYIPKKGKNVLLLSTMHYDNAIDADTGDAKKPEIVTFYNLTKGGVDVVDKMCASYSTNRNSRRWPLTVFFHLLNIAGINSQVVFLFRSQTSLRRKEFLKTLALDLVQPHMSKRENSKNIPRHIREKVEKLSKRNDQEEAGPSAKIPRKSSRCTICPRKKDVKTKFYCQKCSTFMCLGHMKHLCQKCVDGSVSVETSD